MAIDSYDGIGEREVVTSAVPRDTVTMAKIEEACRMLEPTRHEMERLRAEIKAILALMGAEIHEGYVSVPPCLFIGLRAMLRPIDGWWGHGTSLLGIDIVVEEDSVADSET